MIWPDFGSILGDLSPLGRFLVAALWDMLIDLPFGWTGGLISAWLGLRILNLWLMQRTLNKKVGDAVKPGETPNLWKLEARHSFTVQVLAVVLGILFSPLLILVGGGLLIRKLAKRFAKKSPEEAGPDGVKPAEPDGGEALPPQPHGIHIASIVPSLLDGAIAAWCLLLVVQGVDWIVARRYGLGGGASGLDYVMGGLMPDWGWIWPLERFPKAHYVLAAFFWLTVWWNCGRLVRLANAQTLTSNLYAGDEPSAEMPRWRQWYSMWWLWHADDSLTTWLRWLVLAGGLLLGLATLSLDPHPYAVSPGPLALTLATWTAMSLHLFWRGRLEKVPEVVVVKTSTGERKGWFDVRNDLSVRLRVAFPEGVQHVRSVRRLAPMPDEQGLLDPLLQADLLAVLQTRPGDAPVGSAGLVPLQADILELLAANRPLDTRIERGSAGGLSMQASRSTAQTGMDVRWTCVVAPEGAGKSTGAMLAACEMALVDARTTLVICRTPAQARAWRERFDQLVTPSSVRWNIRSAQLGEDYMRRIGDGDVPDVVTLSLSELVTDVLARPPPPRALLRRIGLVVVEDLESYCGVAEAHLQLALRRLRRQLRLADAYIEAEDGRSSLAILALLQPSAPEMVTWAKSICGDDHIVVRHYHAGSESDGERLQLQVLMPLSQIRKANGLAIGVQDVVDSCEQLGVPWTWRRAGDAGRRSGRKLLALREEPKYFCENTADAAIILVAGPWSAVQREWELLEAAGRGFSCFYATDTAGSQSPVFPSDADSAVRNTIVVLSLVDGDENMALEEPEKDSDFARTTARLPRPLVRAPTGDLTAAHLVAELLLDRGVEAGEAIQLFGSDVSSLLQRLVATERATAVPRLDVRTDGLDYLPLVDVRVQSDALPRAERVQQAFEAALREVQRCEAKLAALAAAGGSKAEKRVLEMALRAARATARRPVDVPGPPSDVEVGGPSSVHIFDRTSARALLMCDPDSVPTLYYPGRVLEMDAGRYVVRNIARAADAKDATGPVRPGDVMVEPWIEASETSPRRRLAVELGNREGKGYTRRALALGRVPFDTTLGDATVEIRHVATLFYDPVHGTLIRRTLLTAAEQDAFELASRTETRVLMLHPDCAVLPSNDANPKLQLGSARLIAAAMRMALPSLFRGADQVCGIGVVAGKTSDVALTHDDVLSLDDGIAIYDLDQGGASIVDAIERDSLEVLMRMARRIIERILYHDRLVMRFDEFGIEAEILGAMDEDEELLKEEQEQAIEGKSFEPTGRRARDAERRRRALTWLDSVLAPEGAPVGASSARGYGSDIEAGEGDRFDLGRAWFTRDGSVANLCWSKHRWLLAPGVEAGMDTGLDGRTAADAAGWLREDNDSAEFKKHLEGVTRLVQTGVAIHGPAPVQWIEAQQDVGTSTPTVAPDATAQWLAAAAWSWPMLQPAMRLLRTTWDESDSKAHLPRARTPEMTEQLKAGALAGFVQAMVNDRDRRGVGQPAAPPLHMLMARSGGALDKSLLFATLAWRSGLQAGLFIRKNEGATSGAEVLAALGVQRLRTTGKPEDQVRAWSLLEEWRAKVGLTTPVAMWAVGRGMTQVGSLEDESQVFVPVDLTTEMAPGAAYVDNPADWTFVPMTAVITFAVPPREVRIPTPVEPPVEDPDAPPFDPDAEPETRSFEPDPAFTEGDFIVRKYSFRDPNDGRAHEVTLRLGVEAVRSAVASHGVPKAAMIYHYRDEADRVVKQRAYSNLLASRTLRVADSVIRPDYRVLVSRAVPGIGEVVAALRAAAGNKTEGRKWAGYLAAFAQSLPYRIPKDDEIGSGFVTCEVMPPLETLARGWGDCDTKSILFAALSNASEGPVPVLVSVPMHMFAGAELRPRAEDVSVEVSGATFVLVELTADLPLGRVGSEYTEINGSGRHGESFEVLGRGDL